MQQVNLFLPEFRPKKEWLTAASLASVVIGVIVLFIVFHLLAMNNLQRLKAQVMELENRQVVAQNQLDSMKARAKPFQDNQLDSQLKYLRAALKSRRQVEQIIASQNLGNAAGFSVPMEALARHSFDSIALERIRLSRGGKYLQFKGYTRQPEDVASYVQRLQEDESFSYTRFGLLTLGKKEAAREHSFSLGFESAYDVALENN